MRKHGKSVIHALHPSPKGRRSDTGKVPSDQLNSYLVSMYTETAPHFVTISCRKDLKDLSKLIRLTPYRVGRIKRSADGDKVKVLKSIPAKIAVLLRADMAKSIHKSLIAIPLVSGRFIQRNVGLYSLKSKSAPPVEGP